MERVGVMWECSRCGFESNGAVEVPEALSSCWLEVRASGFEPHLDNGATLNAVRASRGEAKRDGGVLSVRSSCPRCGYSLNLPLAQSP